MGRKNTSSSSSSLKWKKVKVGDKISVHDRESSCFYPCKVLQKILDNDVSAAATSRKSRFLVLYEDRSTAETDLATTKFFWQEPEMYDIEDSDEKEEYEPRDRNARAMRRARRTSERVQKTTKTTLVIDISDGSDGDMEKSCGGDSKEIEDEPPDGGNEDACDRKPAATKSSEYTQSCTKETGNDGDGNGYDPESDSATTVPTMKSEAEEDDEHERRSEGDKNNDHEHMSEKDDDPERKSDTEEDDDIMPTVLTMKRKAAPNDAPKSGVAPKKEESDVKNEDNAPQPEKKVKVENVKKEEITATKKTRKKNAPNELMQAFLARKKASPNTKKKTNRLTVKDVKKTHETDKTTKEDALLSVLMVHHMAGTKAVTFERLFTGLGYRPKNKAVEKAWKEIRQETFVEEAPAVAEGGGTKKPKKVYRLTQRGIDRAAPEGYNPEIIGPAETNAELHESIKDNARNDYSIVVFELLVEAKEKGQGISPRDLADKCGVNKDSHGFFYGFKWLKENGYAILDPKGTTKKGYILSDKCFVA